MLNYFGWLCAVVVTAVTLVIISVVGCTETNTVQLPGEIEERIKEVYKIDIAMFPIAQAELAEAVKNCGPGVIPGVEGKNDCSYQMPVIDEMFLRHPNGKTGLLHDPNEMFQEGVTFYLPDPSVTIPDKYDLRDYMVNGKPEIKQQQCGDCWAWATHHGLEIARAVHDPKPYDHSVQTVLSCSGSGSCGGGYMSAVDYLKKGLPMESDFPYLNGSTGKCKFSKEEQNWNPKVQGTPYIGDSLMYSRAKMQAGQFSEGPKVQDMMRAMVQWKSPLVVTVSAYSVGNGVYDSCGAINSGGNHMVAISGFEMWNGKRVAHVWNSWGPSFGGSEGKGVGKQVWECGDGKLNRGLGVSAKIVQYKSPCAPPVPPALKPEYSIFAGSAVRLGGGVSDPTWECEWTPKEGLTTPFSCQTFAEPAKSTEYHVTIKSKDCGQASAMTLVKVFAESKDGQMVTLGRTIVTPFGEIQR